MKTGNFLFLRTQYFSGTYWHQVRIFRHKWLGGVRGALRSVWTSTGLPAVHFVLL
jgi:hypothetical protein